MAPNGNAVAVGFGVGVGVVSTSGGRLLEVAAVGVVGVVVAGVLVLGVVGAEVACPPQPASSNTAAAMGASFMVSIPLRVDS